MTRKLFGTDGIRGLANSGEMSPEVAFRIVMSADDLQKSGLEDLGKKWS